MNSFAEGDCATDRQGMFDLSHNDGGAAFVQAQRNRAGDIASSANYRKHRNSFLQRLPATTGVVQSAAMRSATRRSLSDSTLLIKTISCRSSASSTRATISGVTASAVEASASCAKRSARWQACEIGAAHAIDPHDADRSLRAFGNHGLVLRMRFQGSIFAPSASTSR